jgi:cobalt-zinc-cadmium efflux system membrane fusion protein
MTAPQARAHEAERPAPIQPAGQQPAVPEIGRQMRALQDRDYRDEPTGLVGEAIPLSALGKAAIGVRVDTVTRKPLPAQIYTTGKIEPIPTRQFVQHALLSGRVKEVRVGLGDPVEAGQVLIILDSPEINQLAAETLQNKEELEAEIRRRTAELDAEVKQAQAQVDLWTAAHNRDKKLYGEGIAPRSQWEKSQAELTNAEARLTSAVRTREVTLSALRVKLKVSFDSMSHRLRQLGVSQAEVDTMLRSKHPVLTVPVRSARSGVVTEIRTSIGSAIDPNDVLYEISDLTLVWATADIYEDDMSRVRLGQKVRAKVAAYPDEVFGGRLSFIGKEVDPMTRTLPVRIEIPNPDIKLKPEMFADLQIETTNPRMSMIVPKESVIQKTGHSLVFVETQGGYQPCRVKVGRSLGDNVEILEGLVPGQRIVVRGAFQLDAELLKAHGSKEMFVQPTEGDELAGHDEHEHGRPAGFAVTPQVILVLIAGAFLLGFVASALVRAGGSKATHERTQSMPADSERVGKG